MAMGAKKLLRQYDGQTENFVQHRRQVWIDRGCLLREHAKVFLVHLGGGHDARLMANGIGLRIKCQRTLFQIGIRPQNQNKQGALVGLIASALPKLLVVKGMETRDSDEVRKGVGATEGWWPPTDQYREPQATQVILLLLQSVGICNRPPHERRNVRILVRVNMLNALRKVVELGSKERGS